MRYGPIGDRDLDNILFRRLGTLADGLGNLAGLASAKPHSTIAIANYNHRAEAEASTALAHVRNSFDAVLDDNFAQFCIVGIGFCSASICFRHAGLP